MDAKWRIVNVSCPACERPSRETVEVVERAATIICAHCGHVIWMDAHMRRTLVEGICSAPSENAGPPS